VDYLSEEGVEGASRSVIELGLDDRRWLDFLASRAEALPFHHPHWAELIAQCYGFRSFALAVADGRERIVAGLPVIEVSRRLGKPSWISLPFTDVCPPLVNDEDAGRLAATFELARSDAGVDRLEVRGPFPGAPGTETTAAVTHLLPLERDADVLARRFRPSVRRNVRSGERRGVVVRRGESRSDLVEVFYRLQLHTRRRLGLPVQPRRFFSLLWEQMLDRELGFLLLAYVRQVPVAGAVFLAWNGTITFKYGASDSTFWRFRPNDVIFAEAIRWACINGYRTFDLGRTSIGSEGLRRFKLGWGAVEEPLVYTAFGEVRRAAPEWSNVLLAAAIRRSPVWLARGIGELFYKYAA
jgi:CelD/BcsL family acetyltransferase involved in cellulose biosynthesis